MVPKKHGCLKFNPFIMQLELAILWDMSKAVTAILKRWEELGQYFSDCNRGKQFEGKKKFRLNIDLKRAL